MREILKNTRILAVLLLVLLTSCIKNIDDVGYNFAEKDLNTIVPGTTTKEMVLGKLGSPSTKSFFGEETWYYISREYVRKAFFEPRLQEQKIVAISFTNQNVTKVETYDKNRAKNIAMTKDITPTEGHEISLVNQLLGNVGRFSSKGHRNAADPRS